MSIKITPNAGTGECVSSIQTEDTLKIHSLSMTLRAESLKNLEVGLKRESPITASSISKRAMKALIIDQGMSWQHEVSGSSL